LLLIYHHNMYKYILDHLPNKSFFRFVDDISSIDENGVTGEYTLREDAFFYEDHFIGNPVTPGVILTEIMAQIGLQSLAIYLLLDESKGMNKDDGTTLFPLLTATDISFYKIVLPGQKMTVISKKEFFRFGKLKCYVEMIDENKNLVAKGMIAGMIKAFVKN
jgi:3-hydroxyacyl-[acyl-carrier-protein] dehydratase